MSMCSRLLFTLYLSSLRTICMLVSSGAYMDRRQPSNVHHQIFLTWSISAKDISNGYASFDNTIYCFMTDCKQCQFYCM